MENLLNGLDAASKISTVTFGVFVLAATALAAVSSYRRHRRQVG
ncbi:hypothetical protein [Nesterenkonia jeotgali]|uniref:Uncharacterized protein n=1 Tax=Nesterenkonia jeotgali TaxID=317018 RepID=A0A839G0B1_9MICC|nr:hypothetical protein [Nesterenkonia jeotgali]MBA8922754.1 hypothetical protein [Nesterenkonia jeotgali]